MGAGQQGGRRRNKFVDAGGKRAGLVPGVVAML